MAYSKPASAIIELLADRPVAYHPALARALGGVKEAIFVGQLLYWHGRGSRKDGYIWKTQAEFEDETALSRSEQETARRHLRKLGVLHEKLRGIPARLHYKLDLDKLSELLQSSMQESSKLESDNPADSDAEIPQSIPESTSESTSEKEPTPSGDSLETEPWPTDSNFTSGGSSLVETTREQDPIMDMLKAKERIGNQASWTIPAESGGADVWANGPLDAFKALVRVPNLPEKKRGKWARELEKVAREWDATPEQLRVAIAEIPRSEYNWRTFTSPYQAGFREVVGITLSRVMAGAVAQGVTIRND